MSAVRRFLMAPTLARLVRKERGAARMVEGYFPPAQGRTSFVRIEGGQCHLVLVGPDEGAKEERTEVPRAHGDALLEASAGRVIFDRSRVSLGPNREASVDHYTKPGRLDLVSVSFESAEEASGFTPPLWFGPEVTTTPSYDGRALAIDGIPSAAEVQPSNAALDALLDQFESRLGVSRYGGSQRLSPEDPRVLDAMRRLTTNPSLAAPPRAPATSPEPRADARPAAPVLPAVAAVAAAAPPPPAAAAPAAPPAPPVPAAPEAVAGATDHLVAPHDPANDTSPVVQDEDLPPPDLDSRMDDVIQNLSQALGAAAAAGDDAQSGSGEGNDEPVVGFGRWSVRARRAQE